MGQSSHRSANLAAPEGRVIGGEVAVRDPEIPLQLDGIARGAFPGRGPLLFLHTGGAPALFAYHPWAL